MLDKSVRLEALIIVISIFLSGCGTLEKNLLFQKNTHNEEQKKLKIENKELPTDAVSYTHLTLPTTPYV